MVFGGREGVCKTQEQRNTKRRNRDEIRQIESKAKCMERTK